MLHLKNTFWSLLLLLSINNRGRKIIHVGSVQDSPDKEQLHSECTACTATGSPTFHPPRASVTEWNLMPASFGTFIPILTSTSKACFS